MGYGRIHFGAMSLVLALGVFQGVIVLALLLRSRKNRTANRLLAGLLVVAVLRILPYILGYAGFYDAYPWLSFAPYNAGLAFGPLVYLYVARLTQGKLGLRWWAHLLPAVLEIAYYSSIFPQSLSFKNAWDVRIQEPWFSPLEQLLTLISASVYVVLAVRRYSRYQQWLSDNVSFRDEFRLPWIRNFLGAFSAMLGVWIGFAAYDRLLHHLNYFNEFPLYVAFTIFVYYLGLEGWRHAGERYPLPDESVEPVSHPVSETLRVPSLTPASQEVPNTKAVQANWQAQGADWLSVVRQRELWRDPDLSSVTLARELGTNTAYLSRAFNEGLGQGFNECINRLRVDAVKLNLASGIEDRDLLTIALAAGFRSKASFNRVFKAYSGQTPSEYRRSAVSQASQIVNPHSS
jgi:AraC-like DNA-binding protein